MYVNIKLKKNFSTAWNSMIEKYGDEFAVLNGFSENILDYTDFIDNFIDKETVADASIDGNANVGHKDIVTLMKEMSKPHQKLLAFNKIFYEINKTWGYPIAKMWLELEWCKALYLHDANTSSYIPYCYAYTLKRLAEEGQFFQEHYNNQPPRHLDTFIDFVKEFVSYTSNRTSGACGLPDLIPYMYYFWREDVRHHHMGITEEYAEKYAKQNIQRFIYAVNQTYVRDNCQSAFTNTSVFDRPYLEALFGGATFPDGSFMIDDIEGIMQFQKWYMEKTAEIREENMFTFPVNSISLLKKNGKFQDEEFARWATRHNMQWLDSNIFCSDEVTSLSNCCFAPDTPIRYYDGTSWVSSNFGDYVNNWLPKDSDRIPTKVTADVKGEFILGPDGNLIEVVAVGRLPNYHEKLIDIELENGSHLRVTPDQKIWDNNSQTLVSASEILADPDKYDI